MIKNYLTSEVIGQKVVDRYQILGSIENESKHGKESKPKTNSLCFVIL